METTHVPKKKDLIQLTEDKKGNMFVVLSTPEEVSKEFTERPFYGPSKAKQTIGIFD